MINMAILGCGKIIRKKAAVHIYIPMDRGTKDNG